MTIEDSKGNAWRIGSKYDEDCPGCDGVGHHDMGPSVDKVCRICLGRGWLRGRPTADEVAHYLSEIEAERKELNKPENMTALQQLVHETDLNKKGGQDA